MMIYHSEPGISGIKRIMLWIIALMVMFHVWGAEDAISAEGVAINGVSVSPGVLTPGGVAEISFSLSRDAVVTILIYSPDYDLVRNLAQKLPRSVGVSAIPWDGRDDAGMMVPNEAYVFTIRAEDPEGNIAEYDPATTSGGDSAELTVEKLERDGSNYRIHYSVTAPSRISLRAGIHKGPLLKTIIDWLPMPPGKYAHLWDGLDETGRVQVMDQSGAHLFLKGFFLPNHAIIVQGSTDDYLEYRNRFKDSSSTSIYQTVKRSALKRINEGISTEYLVTRSQNVSPKFTVYLQGGEERPLGEVPMPTVSGEIGLVVVVDPESVEVFHESRYEIIVYVDNVRFDEEEHAHTPYTYSFDTRKVENGEHFITINQASLTNQVGSYSFTINIKN